MVSRPPLGRGVGVRGRGFALTPHLLAPVAWATQPALVGGLVRQAAGGEALGHWGQWHPTAPPRRPEGPGEACGVRAGRGEPDARQDSRRPSERTFWAPTRILSERGLAGYDTHLPPLDFIVFCQQ